MEVQTLPGRALPRVEVLGGGAYVRKPILRLSREGSYQQPSAFDPAGSLTIIFEKEMNLDHLLSLKACPIIPVRKGTEGTLSGALH